MTEVVEIGYHGDASVEADYNAKIPGSLRSVAPFLEEAQAILRKNCRDGKSLRKIRVAISCIDHAMDLINKFVLKIDDEGKQIMDLFASMRERLIGKLVGTELLTAELTENSLDKRQRQESERPSAEQALVAEANATLELAEEQLVAGMSQSAARNFHTATVYYKVLQSIAPSVTAEIQGKLQNAACRTRMCSHLIENFVHEHFEGRICSDFYDIIGDGGRLGEGSYGSVYLCRNKKSGDMFACKVIGLSRINSHYLRKLHLEIAIMKEVDHPNIVRIHEVFFGTRTVYLIMELCQGGELFSHLTTRYKKGFAENHAALLMRDMLQSVRYLHSKGIVHRDIKLENFLFEVNSTDSRLKLIDFGLSKHCNVNEQMHQIVGSAYYTAPEVLEGHYDHRCDIWSLGVVAYMLLSGAPAFYGDSSEQIHEMIRTKEAQYPSKRFGHCSDYALDFLKRMLTKDPLHRITMEQALEHGFIHSASNHLISQQSAQITRRKSAIPPPSNDVVSSLSMFLKAGKAKKLVMEAVAFSLTPEQIAELTDEFNAVDFDKNGVITMDELKKAIQIVNSKNRGMLQTQLPAFETLGIDTSEQVHYNEFIAAAMCRRLEIDEERILVAFEALDDTGTGFIDKDVIKRVLGSDATDEDVIQVMAEMDYDRDGKIDYREFLRFWKQLVLSMQMTSTKRFANTIQQTVSSTVNSTLNALGRMRSGLGSGGGNGTINSVSTMNSSGNMILTNNAPGVLAPVNAPAYSPKMNSNMNSVSNNGSNNAAMINSATGGAAAGSAILTNSTGGSNSANGNNRQRILANISNGAGQQAVKTSSSTPLLPSIHQPRNSSNSAAVTPMMNRQLAGSNATTTATNSYVGSTISNLFAANVNNAAPTTPNAYTNSSIILNNSNMGANNNNYTPGMSYMGNTYNEKSFTSPTNTITQGSYLAQSNPNSVSISTSTLTNSNLAQRGSKIFSANAPVTNYHNTSSYGGGATSTAASYPNQEEDPQSVGRKKWTALRGDNNTRPHR